MSVPPPYKTTPDQGWSAMRTVLDREMPVRRRRRAVFWLWPLLLVGGSLTAWWWTSRPVVPTPATPAKTAAEVPAIAMLEQPGTPAFSQESHSGMTTASQGQPAQTDIPEATAVVEDPSAQSQQQGAVTPDVVKSHAAGSRPAASPTPPNKSSADVESAIISMADKTTATPQSVWPDPVDRTAPGNAHPEPEATAGIPAAGMKESSLASPALTDPLPLAEVSLGGSAAELVIQTTPAIADARSRRPLRLQPFLYGGGQTGIQMGSGYQVGAGAQLALNRRFSLSTSLGYHAYRPQGSLFAGRKEEADYLGNASPIVVEENFGQAGSEMVIPVSNLSSGLTHDALVPLIESVNQWQWHLGANLHAGRRWTLESGLGLGWGTRAISRFPIVTYPDIGSADLIMSTDQLHEFGLVKRTTTSWYVGAAYAPVRGLEIFGRWSAAMTDYLTLSNQLASWEVSTREDRINTLQAGIRLRLGS